MLQILTRNLPRSHVCDNEVLPWSVDYIMEILGCDTYIFFSTCVACWRKCVRCLPSNSVILSFCPLLLGSPLRMFYLCSRVCSSFYLARTESTYKYTFTCFVFIKTTTTLKHARALARTHTRAHAHNTRTQAHAHIGTHK